MDETIPMLAAPMLAAMLKIPLWLLLLPLAAIAALLLWRLLPRKSN